MKRWFLSKKARPDVSRETSGEEHINVLDGERVVQREIDRVADKPGAVAHAGVDIPRCDEKLRILGQIDLRAGKIGAERARIYDRRHPDGDDRNAERLLCEGAARVADAGAGDDARIRYLHRAAKPRRLARRKRVYGDHTIRPDERYNAADERRAFDAGRAENAGTENAHRAKRRELFREPCFQMARDENALGGERPDGVRGNIRIPQTDNKNALLRLHGKLRADLARENAAGAAETVTRDMTAEAVNEPVQADAGVYTHTFKKPFEYAGETYTTLTFDFEKMTGRDMVSIETEMQMNNEYCLAPEVSRSFQAKMAAKAAGIGSDVLDAMPIKDFNRITNAARSFLIDTGY